MAIDLARRHAERAGVERDIHVQQRDFLDLSSKSEYGVIVTNPPYGQRLGDPRELNPLYHAFPTVLSRLPTWSVGVLTGFPGFEQAVARKADRRRKLFNARVEATYYQFDGPRPPRNAGDNHEHR
jgi:23S rRNA (guanine2445-N2)-methyltransferase / 23S rRNA (guanine2069-N7)-methyltransferase